MLLSNLLSVTDNKQVDILTEGEKIISVDDHSPCPRDGIIFDNAIVFPGLINSHDHLDFNLFPKLGNKKYASYVEWGNDIHAQNRIEIDKVLKIPQDLRVQWGIYKNLLNGITTVVNHGPLLQADNNIITVWQKSGVLHSVQLEKWWRLKLNLSKKQPVVIHVGEGTDENAHREIDQLLKWNIFKKELVGVHGIAMDEKQAEGFKALVWCPDSNYFLISKTAQIDKLKAKTKIVFGTDSTLSSSWNLWEHLRLARQQKTSNDSELFDMLTTNPARLWPIPSGGELKKGYYADIVIAKKGEGANGLDSFYNFNPEDILLVMHKGKISLFDESLKPQLEKTRIDLNPFSKVILNKQIKYVLGDLPELVRSIRTYNADAKFPVEIA